MTTQHKKRIEALRAAARVLAELIAESNIAEPHMEYTARICSNIADELSQPELGA